jgi:hypothetical protein
MFNPGFSWCKIFTTIAPSGLRNEVEIRKPGKVRITGFRMTAFEDINLVGNELGKIINVDSSSAYNYVPD